MPNTILPTANIDWGFFGTLGDHADQTEAWNLAMPAIQLATGSPPTIILAG